MTPDKAEPLSGAELLRISLETYEIHLKFDNQNTLQLSSSFVVATSEGKEFEIEPSSHRGQLSKLWDCIGATVITVVWQDQIELGFSNGSLLVVRETSGQRRGALVGPAASGYGYDEF